MTAALPLILKLQAEAANPDASVTNLLRMAKIAATKLNLTDALIWIDKELNGYGDLTVEDLPPYRRPMGIPQGYNPVHGWQPIHFPDTKTANICSEAFIGLALGAIEKKMLRPTVDCVHFFGFATGTGSPMWHMCHTAGVMQRQNQCPVTLITTCDRHRGEHFPLAQSAPGSPKTGGNLEQSLGQFLEQR